MARDWQDLFVLERPPEAADSDGKEAQQRRSGLLHRLRESLGKTRRALGGEIRATLGGDLDDEAWERLEEALIAADVGVRTTAAVVEQLEHETRSGQLSGGDRLTARLVELLAERARVGEQRIDLRQRPTVILMVGVNGTGKTTSIGKLAWQLRQLGQTVVIGAADTFRAAAVEQLEAWARRAGCELVKGAPDSDPGAVAFDAIATAQAQGADVAIIDTAGRLHTQQELMAELSKISRVIAKRLPGAPHETLLTIDATTGQNGLHQARLFAAAAEVSGIVLTKLDGTAKGGITLAIAAELGIPVKLIGIGEALEDLRPFDAEDFARALVD